MIKVTRLKGSVFYINEDMIEFIEETPDTVITLNTDKKLVVLESADEILNMIVAFKKKVYLGDFNHLINRVEGEIK